MTICRRWTMTTCAAASRPCTRRIDEATAILAGDSLHALAFEILADPATHPDAYVRAELVLELARAAGPSGMAGGQAMDIEAEKSSFDLSTVTRLQAMKTGALIACAVEAGAILGRVPPEGRTPLRGYARDVGLAFQIADDILDVEGDEDGRGEEAAQGRRSRQGDLPVAARPAARARTGADAGRPGDRASSQLRRGSRSAARHCPVHARARPVTPGEEA